MVLGGPTAALVSGGITGSVVCQISRVITWMAPAVGMAISAATKAPKVPPSQLPFYLERGYDRVSGFVNRASEVAHLSTPRALYRALGRATLPLVDPASAATVRDLL